MSQWTSSRPRRTSLRWVQVLGPTSLVRASGRRSSTFQPTRRSVLPIACGHSTHGSTRAVGGARGDHHRVGIDRGVDGVLVHDRLVRVAVGAGVAEEHVGVDEPVAAGRRATRRDGGCVGSSTPEAGRTRPTPSDRRDRGGRARRDRAAPAAGRPRGWRAACRRSANPAQMSACWSRISVLLMRSRHESRSTAPSSAAIDIAMPDTSVAPGTSSSSR